jgi:hypothetical protein
MFTNPAAIVDGTLKEMKANVTGQHNIFILQVFNQEFDPIEAV